MDKTFNVYTRKVDTPTIELKGPAKAGLNSVRWMADYNGVRNLKKSGDYRVILTIDGKEYYQTLHIEDVTKELLAGVQVKYLKKKEQIMQDKD